MEAALVFLGDPQVSCDRRMLTTGMLVPHLKGSRENSKPKLFVFSGMLLWYG